MLTFALKVTIAICLSSFAPLANSLAAASALAIGLPFIVSDSSIAITTAVLCAPLPWR